MEHCDGGELLKAEAIRKARFALIACHLAQNPKPVWQVVREGRRQGDALPERWAVKRSDGSSAQANTRQRKNSLPLRARRVLDTQGIFFFY